MSGDLFAALLDAIAALLGRRPTVAGRRATAAILQALAAHQFQVAAAQERAERRPPEERPGRVVRRQAGPGAPAGQTVLIARRDMGGLTPKIYVQIGRGLLYAWQAAHGPEPIRRVAVERGTDGRVRLVVAQGDLGFALQARSGTPARFWADSARDQVAGYDGHYHAEVEPDRLTLHERV